MKKQIPNLLTITNLLLGLISILWASQNIENLVICSWLILVAILFDFMDGKLARYFNVANDFGKQLDSLADMISFGVGPGIIVFQLISLYNPQNPQLAYVAFMIPIFSAIRLAKYNIDEKQGDYFIGISTPINALFFCSIPIIINYEYQIESNIIGEIVLHYITDVNFLFMSSIIFSLLLIYPIKTFSLKSFNDNCLEKNLKLIFIITSFSLFFLLKYTSFPLIVFFYIFLSIIFNINKK